MSLFVHVFAHIIFLSSNMYIAYMYSYDIKVTATQEMGIISAFWDVNLVRMNEIKF